MRLDLESGDRAAFLARARAALARDVPANLAHPLPPPLESVPLVRSKLLDPGDVLGSFVANALAAHAGVHVVDGDIVPADVLTAIIAAHGVQQAAISAEPAAAAVGAALRELGVQVAEPGRGDAADADLGVTSCIAAIATTGTVVVSSAPTGARSASLLPRVHLCVVPASVVVPSSAEVLRALPAEDALPANLVLVTGPSKSGDIEQIIVTGVHGPVALELVLLRDA